MLTERDLDPPQLDAISFIDGGEDSLLVADVGTGKTVIALTAGRRALMHGDVNRWLVLAPKLVADDTWRIEPGEWEHLQDVSVEIATGTEQQRLRAVQSTAQFVVMNYENLNWLLDLFPRIRHQDTLPFDGLICDEIDKLKTVSTDRFKGFRNRVKRFRKRVGLTGTLVPNELTEMWGQIYMVDGGDTFVDLRLPSGEKVGRSFYKWRKHFFYPTDFNQHQWAPFPDTEQRLLEALDGLAYRLPASGIPPAVPAPSHMLDLPPSIRAKYRELEKEYYLIVKDQRGADREVEAANTAVMRGKLQQITAGFLYVDKTQEAVWHSDQRFGWLEDLRARLDRQLLVFYHFTAELDELKRRYKGIKYLGAGVSDRDKRTAIAAWNAGDIPLLALHPASAGHGLNLQKSGAHDLAFLTMPWSGGLYKQVVGRLARRGQTAPQIDVHTALCRDTIDNELFGIVTGKIDSLESFQDAMYQRQCRA